MNSLILKQERNNSMENKIQARVFCSTRKCKQVGKPAAIESLIPIGEENAIHAKELSALLNCTERELRMIVATARNNGKLICSSNSGYYRPSCKREIQDYVRTMQAHATSVFKTLQGAKKELEKMEGQQELPQENVSG